ncbi:membrane protein [Ureaplasma diversum]|uniref:Uncharacterized protein n=2 Tax=Ureaplasma diversum TaxID=42094 RepID=A0A084F0N3_9BACT|nr:hypothetical protein [Ureaplasma diversum]AJQ45222.1 membrane protein [Ureaplasma diversum]KEZ23775.1 Hypothetical protein, predicted transmembrane protein [Ureaplasma diversum NCTC 246]
MKTILIINKSYDQMRKFDTKILHDSGPLFSNERYLSIVRQSFDAHIRYKSRPLFLFMNWWFQTTNYKLNPDISKAKRSWKEWLVEIFFWLCIVGLFACIFAGVAKPIIEATILTVKQIRGTFSDPFSSKTPDADTLDKIASIWQKQFSDSSVIAPLCITMFFMFFSFLYIYMVKKIRPRTNKMSVEEYLVARMNKINSFKFILKREVKLIPGVKEFNHRFIFNMNVDYGLLRLMNYIYSGLKEMNVIMVIDIDDTKLAELQKVMKQDFDNLSMIILDQEVATNLKSIHHNGILNETVEINVDNKHLDKTLDVDQITIV